MPRKLKSTALRSDAVTISNIPDNEITAAKLHTTAIQDKLGYTPASAATVASQLATLVDSAPATLDTLNELAAALGDDPNFATTITNALAAKANTSSLASVATSGSYNDLNNKPTLGALAALSSVGTSQISGWGQSVSGNGYVQFPGGLILQWCTGGAVASESDMTTTFPIAFPNACLNVIVGTYMPSGDRDGMFQMRYYDRFGVTARFNQFNSAGGTGYPTVFAIGY